MGLREHDVKLFFMDSFIEAENNTSNRRFLQEVARNVAILCWRILKWIPVSRNNQPSNKKKEDHYIFASCPSNWEIVPRLYSRRRFQG